MYNTSIGLDTLLFYTHGEQTMRKQHFWRRLWQYYKWHILFLVLIAICVGFIFSNMTQKKEPDISICYIGKNYINVQTFNDNKKTIELLLHDANGDGEKFSAISAYPVDLESDLHEVFEKIVGKDTQDIFISEKTAFTKYEDKSVFVTASEYVDLSELPVDTLKDDDGRVYAVSLDKSRFMERLGFAKDVTGLYIAAVNPKGGGELTKNRKNGRNIAGYILTQE